MPFYCTRCDTAISRIPCRACGCRHWSRACRADVDRLVADNRGLIGFTITRYILPRLAPERHEPLRDTIESAGMLGLLMAARRFNPARGFAFTTYAVTSIQRAVWKDITQDGHHEQRREPHDLTSLPDPRTLPDRRHDGHGLDELPALLARLDGRERLIVGAMLDGKSTQAVGEELGISRQRVRQIRQRAVERMGEDW